MKRTNRSLRLAFLGLAITAIVFVVWDALSGDGGSEPKVIPLPSVRTAQDLGPRTSLKDPLERFPTHQKTVRITVESAAGGMIEDAVIECASGAYRVLGSADFPAGLGEAIVSSAGYASQVIQIDEDDVTVRLVPGWTVRGRVFDAVTGQAVPVDMRLTDATSHGRIRRFEADGSGQFTIEGIVSGTYSIHGEKRGYLDICAHPRSTLPGLHFEVHEQDLMLEIPMYPIYAGALALENETNLTDHVFDSLITTRSRFAAGLVTPRYHASRMESEVAAAAKKQGYPSVFVTVRTLTELELPLDASADLLFPGEALSRVSYPLRPIEDVLHDVKPHVVTIRRRWRTAELSIDAPVKLKLAPRGALAGGITMEPGTTRLELPYGEYDIMPVGIGSLLDEDEWSAGARVPEEARIVVDPESGFAKLTLEKSDNWQEGMLEVSGEGRIFSLWPHAEFPRTVYASPGDYTLRIVTGRADDSVYRTVWREKIELSKGQAVTVRVGDSR